MAAHIHISPPASGKTGTCFQDIRALFARWSFAQIWVVVRDRLNAEPVQPAWRATGQDNQLVGQAIGQMVHKVIQRWRSPGAPPFSDRMVCENCVVEESQRQYALAEASRLLARFQSHPLWQTIDQEALRRQ